MIEIKNEKIRNEIITYAKQFNNLFSLIKGDKKEIWKKGADVYIELLKKIEQLSEEKKINRLQKSRMNKALNLVFSINFWKNNPNISDNCLKEAGNYFMKESIISTFKEVFQK